MIEFVIKFKKYLKIRLLQIFRVNKIFQILIFFERVLKSKYYKNSLLKKVFNEKDKEFYFIYDLSVSPISYGDFIYSTFFATAIFQGSEEAGVAAWGKAVTVSSLIIAFISPIMGAIADRGGYRKLFLILTP